MKERLFKYLSFGLIVVFLIPQVWSVIHNYGHKDVDICKSVTHHLHKEKQNCEICDFYLPVTTIPITQPVDFSIYKVFLYTVASYEQLITGLSRHFITLRGPPAVSG